MEEKNLEKKLNAMKSEPGSGIAPGRRTPLMAALLRSFYSFAFYSEVRNDWKGRGFVYLLFLSAVAALFQSGATIRSYRNFVDEELPKIIATLPAIRIEEGVSHIEEGVSQPFYLMEATASVEGEGKRPIAILDTTGKIVSLESTEALILITRGTIQVRGMGESVTELPLSELDDMTIDRETVQGAASQVAAFLPIAIFPMALGLGFLYRAAQMYFFSIMSRAWLLRRNVMLPTPEIQRLTAAALTPAVVIESVFLSLDVQLPLLSLFYQLVAAVYVFQTIRTQAASTSPTASTAA